MRRVTGFEDLATQLGGTIDGRSCRVAEVDVDDGPLLVEGLQADRLEIADLEASGPVVFRNCFVADLQLSRCGADGVLLIGCRVERLVVRNLERDTRLKISGGNFVRIAVRDADDVSVDGTECDSSLTITGVRRRVSLDGVTAGSVTVAEQLAVDPGAEVHIARVRVADNLEVHDLHLSRFSLADSLLDRHLRLRRLILDGGLVLDNVRCESRVLLDNVTCDAPVTLARCTLGDGLEATRLRRRTSASPVLVLATTRVGTSISVTLATTPGDVVLEDCEVDGRIVFPHQSPRYRMEGTTAITEIEVPQATVRTAPRIEELAVRLFGESSAAVYGVMRSSFGGRQRHVEEDLCYFLQRNAESNGLRPPARWIARYIYGSVLGWGVRIWPPVRAMALGVTLTAIVLGLTAPASVVPDGDVGSAVTLAGALWFNVGTGLPSQLTSATWSAAAVTLTGLGTLLITVIVGITIRRLVR